MEYWLWFPLDCFLGMTAMPESLLQCIGERERGKGGRKREEERG